MNGGFTFCSVAPAHSTPHTDPNEEYTMHRNLTTTLIAAGLALTLSGASIAGPREDQLAQYASAAKAANPAFSAFLRIEAKLCIPRHLLAESRIRRLVPRAMARIRVLPAAI
jgi:hypothetical protein